MEPETNVKYHFTSLHSKMSETPDDKGNRKSCFISEEHNNELHLFLWVNKDNQAVAFQFFFFEKVLEWTSQSGLTTNITNRIANPIVDKIGLLKGTRTLIRFNDPSILDEANEILSHSVFPIGIKDILENKIIKTGPC